MDARTPPQRSPPPSPKRLPRHAWRSFLCDSPEPEAEDPPVKYTVRQLRKELADAQTQRAAAEERISEYAQDLIQLKAESNLLRNSNNDLMSRCVTVEKSLVEQAEALEALTNDNRDLLQRVMVAPEPEPVDVQEVLKRHHECHVCNESRRMTLMLPCFHTCCSSCVNQWATTQEELKCPYCRAPVQFTHSTKDGLTIRWTRGETYAAFTIL